MSRVRKLLAFFFSLFSRTNWKQKYQQEVAAHRLAVIGWQNIYEQAVAMPCLSDLALESAGIFDDALQMLTSVNANQGLAPNIRYRLDGREVSENAITLRYQKQHLYPNGVVTDVREGEGFFQEAYVFGPERRFDRGHGKPKFNWINGATVTGYIETQGRRYTGTFERVDNSWRTQCCIIFDSTVIRWSIQAV